jgi:hypothetical protein
MIRKLIIIVLFLFAYNANAQDCKTIPQSFNSYQQAVKAISNSTFPYTDKFTTSSSSWIRSATFKSCDGKTGFLIIGTDSDSYIHQNVPISLWQNFKRASSYGSFYTKNLRGRYKLIIK